MIQYISIVKLRFQPGVSKVLRINAGVLAVILSRFKNLIGNCLFHEINFTLFQKFEQTVMKGDYHHWSLGGLRLSSQAL